MEKISQSAHIQEELRDHLPYSFASTVLGIAVLGFLSLWTSRLGNGGSFSGVSIVLFHLFHPLHVFFSATTTAAMFSRHERNILKTVGVSVASSVPTCVLSDVLFPYLGGNLLGIPMAFHLDFVIQPFWMSLVLLGGVLTGSFISDRIAHSTLFSHAIHIFISTMASLTYLIGFGLSDWLHYLVAAVLLGILAVIVPCCLGDIVIPHLFTEKVHRH